MATNYLKTLLGMDEQILRVARQHWFVLVRSIILEIFIILIIIALAAALVSFFPPLAPFILPLTLLVLLFPIATFVRDILVWANQQFVVTTRRVIHVKGLFNKSVIDSSLEKVNDVKMDQSYLGRVFDYGNIEILTASELGVNQFSMIEQPVKFKTAMLNAKAQLEHGDIARAYPAPDIPGMIAELDVLRQQGVLTEAEFQQKKAELLAKM